MKQILQSFRDGETVLVEIPRPRRERNEVQIRTLGSLVSLGTERMLVDFGKASWLAKARQQPDKVLQVIDKIKSDGIAATYKSVNAKLDLMIPLGYSNVGQVIDLDADNTALRKGDVVISNGPHAEVVSVSKNLVARVPNGVSVESASFTIVGSIALQGIRLLKPAMGEIVVVTGLGLIGMMAVQLLRAHGCQVIGIDLDSKKCRMAEGFGATVVNISAGENPVDVASGLTSGRGVDGVIITASTQSNEPVHQAATMCRKRGRIVLVGVTGLSLSRADFYEKELSFQVSCSYGPGRYDREYEEKGNDYPYGFVRWTEQRNFEAVLQLMASGDLDLKPLISHRFGFSDALMAYKAIGGGNALGIVLEYGDNTQWDVSSEEDNLLKVASRGSQEMLVSGGVTGFIGSGGFARQILLPAIKATGCRLKTVVSSKGVSGTQVAQKYGFEYSTTDPDALLSDGEVDTVLITTRHESHAGLVKAALLAGKKVFVEKPLCLSFLELQEIESIYRGRTEEGANPFLMVGFNRRFAPQVEAMRRCLKSVQEPVTITMIINAGTIPREHWTQDPRIGGGRIIGEACHFIDLSRFLAGSPILRVQAIGCESHHSRGTGDTVSIGLKFENGSLATIQYLSNGHQSVPKERIEVFAGGKVLQLDNFRRLKAFGWKGFKGMNLWKQDKGHRSEMKCLMDAVREGKASPIPFDEIVEVTRASFEAAGVLTTD